ncbi:hypothetical protein [Stenotrophomonas mori]|uniref:Uncharacterized protein n=1 Tax=Stenotrophomonas mori TaxID=2871096 RepID=A0ABT0SIJ2_9GAMM|nr:hypothetical protein [Stenotrophomonas mori]MCL7715156.1 hypothetical protein [Stenotrophomonas mori]
MSRLRNPLAWGIAVIAIGAVAVVGMRWLGGGATGAAPETPPDTVATPPSAAAPARAAGGEDTPPWMRGAAETGTAAGALAARAPAPAEATPTQVDIDRSLAEIRQKSDHNIRAADDMLLQLDALEKAGKTPPDVHLDALRNNLVIAKRAQLLARELAESTQHPDSPQRRQRNAEIIAELQQLQGQLRYDVGTVLPPAAPGRAQ